MCSAVRRMARPEGFEPPTYGFEARRSIQLSYGRVTTNAITVRASPRTYSLSGVGMFREVLKSEGIRTWLGWDHTARAASNQSNLNRLFSWMSREAEPDEGEEDGEDIDGGSTSDPVITTGGSATCLRRSAAAWAADWHGRIPRERCSRSRRPGRLRARPPGSRARSLRRRKAGSRLTENSVVESSACESRWEST